MKTREKCPDFLQRNALRIRGVTFLLVALLFLHGSAERSRALTIVLNDITPGGMNPLALSGFQQAAAAWQSLLSDNVTLKLNIGFQSLGGSILGQTDSTEFIQLYSNIRTAMVADQTSANDTTATTFLPAGPGLKLLTNDPTTGAQVVDNNGSANNIALDITRANAKALGLSTNLLSGGSNIPNPNDISVVDGSVTFNSDFTFDFDPSDGVGGSSIDFIGVAIHEIGHALGFTSGVDTIDALSGPNFCVGVGCGATDLNGFAVLNTLDLFRYSVNSVANTALSAHQGGNPYFSLNAGATNIALFSTGPYDGDGRQASHWKDFLGLGIMDPTFGLSETGVITNLDLQAMDVIGWNLSAAGLNDSQITVSSSPTLAFGRVMVNSTPTAQTVSLSKTGTKSTTYGPVANPNLTVTASGAFAAGGQSENISVNITPGITTTGNKNFTLSIDNTAPTATAIGFGSLDQNDGVAITATAVANRVITGTSVSFGSVFAGTAVNGNSSLTTTGADTDRTRVTVNGTAVAADANGIGVNAGSGQLFNSASSNTSRTLAGTFATAGAKSGSRSLSLTGEGLAGESVQPVNVAYTATVYDHGKGSFVNSSVQNALTIDFGSHVLGDVITPMSFDIFNLLATAGFTAGIQYSAPLQTGDFTVLTTTLQGISPTTLAAGSSLPYLASFNTGSAGTFQAVFTLDLIDPSGILGGGDLPNITLTLKGSVFNAGLPEPTSGWLLLAGMACLVRRRSRK